MPCLRRHTESLRSDSKRDSDQQDCLNHAWGHLENGGPWILWGHPASLSKTLLSSFCWLSGPDSGSSHAHRLPTKLLHPASVLLFTLGFLSSFSSVSNNLYLIISRYLTKTHALAPRVCFFCTRQTFTHWASTMFIPLKSSSCYLIIHHVFHTYNIFCMSLIIFL